MPSINGQVQAISIKPLNQPDNYGNTFRASVKVQDEFYSYGNLKKDRLNIKNVSDWIELQKGMEVEFMYDVNGSFKNVKKQSFSILDATSAQPVQQRSQAPVKQQSSNGGGFVNPAEIGQCLNLAVEVLKLDGKQLLDDTEVTKAIAWYKAVREKFNTLYSGVEATETVEAKPKKALAKKAPPVEEDLYEDGEV